MLLLSLASAMRVRAEVVGAESLEYLADVSPEVGIYAVKKTSVGVEGKITRVEIVFELAEPLRGEPPREDSLRAGYARVEDVPPLPEAGSRFLLFLGPPRSEREPRRMRAINLTQPVSEGPGAAFTSDFTVLTNRAEIVVFTKARIAGRAADPKAEGTSVQVPSGTAAWRAIWQGSSCFLTVPDDLARAVKP